MGGGGVDLLFSRQSVQHNTSKGRSGRHSWMQEKRDPRLDEEEKKKYIEGPQSATQGKWVEERERECEGEDEMHFLMTGWPVRAQKLRPVS